MYLASSIIIALLSIKPFPKGDIIGVILFGALRAFSTFNNLDWIILALFPLAGGLLFANCSFWKCKSKKSSSAGLVAGLLAAICPACILPIFGATLFVTFLTKISIYIKIAGLIFIIGGTYYVANTNCTCLTKK